MARRGSGKAEAKAKPADAKTIGQLTSHIRNKQKRSETYAKLKSQQKVQ